MEKPWLKHYDEGVPATIEYPQIPLDQFLTDAATRHPDHTAIIFGAALGSRVLDASITYRQLDDAVNRFAAGLQQMGVEKGKRAKRETSNVTGGFAFPAHGNVIVA